MSCLALVLSCPGVSSVWHQTRGSLLRSAWMGMAWAWQGRAGLACRTRGLSQRLRHLARGEGWLAVEA